MRNNNNTAAAAAAEAEAKLAEAEAAYIAKLAEFEAKLAAAEATAIAALEAAAAAEAKLAEKPVSTGGKLSKKLFVKALLSTKACTIAEVTSALIAEYGVGGDVPSQSLINDLRYIDKVQVGRAPNEAGRGFRFYIPNTEADAHYMLTQKLAALEAAAAAAATPQADTSVETENTSASE